MARVDTLEARLCDYIAGKLANGSEVRVEEFDRIFGGASRETYRFVLHWKEDAEDHCRRLILRRDPPSSLIETDRAVEFAAYQAFQHSAVPVPEALWYWGSSSSQSASAQSLCPKHSGSRKTPNTWNIPSS